MSCLTPKTATLSIVAATLLATCCGAQAANNSTVLTVTAEIKENNCELDMRGNSELHLGDFSSIAFGATAGKTVGAKDFALNLKDCGKLVKNAVVNVSGTADTVNSKAFANATGSGAAQGVAVTISGGNTPAAIEPKGDATYSLKPTKDQILTFTAGLISTAADVKPGKVSVPITLTVTYS